MKTLVLYVFHEINKTVKFFVKHGLRQDNDVDFFFIINNPELKFSVPVEYTNVSIINRDNNGLDFGGWSYALFLNDQDHYLYTKYDRFIFINSTARGPFFPVWASDRDWIKIFNSLITDDIKLAGTTIGFLEHQPHIQSMFLVTDRIGLDIAIKCEIFTPTPSFLPKNQIIRQKEVGWSTAILKEGYNIKCLLKAFDGVDFRKKCGREPFYFVPFMPNEYYGFNVHPYEVIFIKVNGESFIEKFTDWSDISDVALPLDFNWQEYLLVNPDIAIKQYGEYFAKYHWFNYGIFEKRQYKLEQPLEQIFNWQYYIDKYPDLPSAGINNYESALQHYIMYGKKEGRLAYPDKSS